MSQRFSYRGIGDWAERLSEAATGPHRLRWWSLILFVTLQAVSAGFFVGDVFFDALSLGIDRHTGIEMMAVLALILGVLLGGYEMTRILRRTRANEDSLRMATGAFAELLEQRFAEWRLTPAEAEVALLTLKGFDISEIASLRSSAPGTVRVQLARVYAKSQTSGRAQFVTQFIDALLDDPILPSAGDRGRERAG